MDRKFVLKGCSNGSLEAFLNENVYTRYHFNTCWLIKSARRDNDVVFQLVSRQSNESNLWSVDVEYTFSILPTAGESTDLKKFTSEPLRDVFNSQKRKGQVWSVSSPEIDKYMVDDVPNISCEVSIIKTRGIRQKRKQNFDEPIDGKTDVVLVVGEKKFHAVKMILANMSPVFKAMFYGNFQESKMTEVKIEDVEPDDFENLLSFIHQAFAEVDWTNVSKMLKIADRFDVEPLTRFCEQFLITDRCTKIPEKLKLSEEFNLPDLQDSCLETFKTRESMRECLKYIDKMGELTVKALFKKAFYFR